VILAQASPNIALIKYWGKQPFESDPDRNWPLNPSLSFTLSRARTRLEISAAPEFSLWMDGAPAGENDAKKFRDHVARMHAALSERHWITGPAPQKFRIDSSNNFPTGTGMASSASAFAALTVGLMGYWMGVESARQRLEENRSWISSLARRGSGSAARSLFGNWSYWEGAEARAVPCPWELRDTVVIFSTQPKKIPSSQGHEAARTSPLLPARLRNLSSRIDRVRQALEARSLAQLGPLIEEEALEMHQVAESGSPAVSYLSPESRNFIRYLQSLKNRDFYFTADAGPNLHLISERSIEPEIQQALTALRMSATLWADQAGAGPCLEERP
jgi:diphosphomevalonate decarboxylase